MEKPATAYKILTADQWAAFERAGRFAGAPVDLADGYIHLSTAAQLGGTAAKHFAGQDGLVLAEVELTLLGEAVRWEVSRGGALFPHLYGVLERRHVVQALPMPAPALTPVSLGDAHGGVEPLARRHHDALVAAVSDGELWRLWYTTIPSPERMMAEIERRLALWRAGRMLPFAVLAPGGRVVGMTSYMNVEAGKPRLEIGSTWLARSVQRTALNTAAKRLLLTHAFDTIGCLAVELRTNFLNVQSRRAIERLGARLDGVLRAEGRAADGTIRDACVYSITAGDWPGVRSNLDWQLARPR